MPDSVNVKFVVRVHHAGYSYEELRRIWLTADRLGYHSATLYDLINIPALECWTTLTALATETRQLRVMPLVLANLYRHPGLLAKMCATLDVISGGRLELGIGAGGDGNDHRAHGLSFPNPAQRVDMLEEATSAIKQLWTMPQLSLDGRFYSFDNAVCEPKPLQAPHPPVLIGGHGEVHLLRAVAKHADICNMGFEMTPDEHRAKLDMLAEHCRQVGRNPEEIEVSHNTRVKICATEGEVRGLLADGADAAGMSVDAYEDSVQKSVIGTPDQSAAKLQTYVDMGVTRFFLIFPDPISSESLEMFASTVMERFKLPLNNSPEARHSREGGNLAPL